ncbi:MAG TPA: hypothetical protein VGC42_07260 [Kofleriaceae bacterium]
MSQIFAGAYMQPGDSALYWPAYADRYIPVELAAATAADLVVAQSARLPEFLAEPAALAGAPRWSFFPPMLAPGTPGARTVDAIMTGGRTFLLTEHGAESLGIPPRIYLDLGKMGWSDGLLELRPELKGAGTLFDRTLLDRARLARELDGHPELARAYHALGSPPALALSLAMYLKRILGGQDDEYARHSVRVSNALLGTSQLRFTPVWQAIQYPEAVVRNLAIVSRALPPETPVCDRGYLMELRFTPSTVRAIYFDTARSDAELRLLARRVSDDPARLHATWVEMIADARRYLETITLSSHVRDAGIGWTKAGDINEMYKPDERGTYDLAYEFRNRRRVAWFLAKDEVIVAGLGKVFTDTESYFGGTTRFVSADRAALAFHHELYLLMVLRDHLRVCAAFRVAIELAAGRPCDARARLRLQAETAARLEHAINASPHLRLQLRARDAVFEHAYPQLDGASARYRLPRWQLREAYA